MWAGYRSARAAARPRTMGEQGSKHRTRALWTTRQRHRHGMQPLIALLLAAAAACAVARPPGPTAAPALLPAHLWPQRIPAPPVDDSFGNFLMPRILFPHLLGYEESPHVRVPPPVPENDWLNKEIDRINQMEEEETINPYEVELARWIAQDPNMQRIFEVPLSVQEPFNYAPELVRPAEKYKPIAEIVTEPDLTEHHEEKEENNRVTPMPREETREEQRKKFALTPLDKGYFDRYDEISKNRPKLMSGVAHEGGEPIATIVLQPPRQIRQNPNLNKQKNLLEPDIGKLKIGLANKDYRLPVSLLPTNLRWLKVNQPIDDDESSHEDIDASDKPYYHLLETSAGDPADSIYGVALVAAVGAALIMVFVGFAFGWYTLSKKAKAAADVDYPAYGVTGPTIDTSGDRKLAHSAHMYHYQHQKQQIIAMERNGLEQRTGSVSDPESEEENEEGDYTVYECPGFATTGEMEVKNPLFNEDPTPGKCEVVKQQPKE